MGGDEAFPSVIQDGVPLRRHGSSKINKQYESLQYLKICTTHNIIFLEKVYKCTVQYKSCQRKDQSGCIDISTKKEAFLTTRARKVQGPPAQSSVYVL